MTNPGDAPARGQANASSEEAVLKKSRKELRVPVDCAVTFFDGLAHHDGTAKDVSMHGCQVEGAAPPARGTLLSFRLWLPDATDALEIELARVQWVEGTTFGLNMLVMGPDSQKRLRRFLENNYLRVARARRAHGRPPLAAVIPRQPQEAVAVPTSAPRSSRPPDNHGALPATAERDQAAFTQWVLEVRRAVAAEIPVPSPPRLEEQELQTCAQFICGLLPPRGAGHSRATRGLVRAPDQERRPRTWRDGRLVSVVHREVARLSRAVRTHVTRLALPSLAADSMVRWRSCYRRWRGPRDWADWRAQLPRLASRVKLPSWVGRLRRGCRAPPRQAPPHESASGGPRLPRRISCSMK